MTIHLPIIPNEVFDSSELGKSSELAVFDLHEDVQFGFYFNSAFQSVNYDAERYQNEQAFSSIFVSHLKIVANEIEKRFGKKIRLAEVGCGKGYFFRLLSDRNFFDLRGFDKTYEGDDTRIAKRYLNISDMPLNADVIVLRHVLEHVQNPVEFLRDLVKINGKACSFVIEVPSMDWVIDNSTYWDFTYEHVNYFSSESFKKIFDNSEIIEVFDRQYLLVFSSSDSLTSRTSFQIRSSNLLTEMISSKIEHSKLFGLAIGNGDRYWIWGGATKGILVLYHLLQYKSRVARRPEGIIDINPAKQGKFSAGTGIEIISPKLFLTTVQNDDVVFVANPIYKTEVKKFLEASSFSGVNIQELA